MKDLGLELKLWGLALSQRHRIAEDVAKSLRPPPRLRPKHVGWWRKSAANKHCDRGTSTAIVATARHCNDEMRQWFANFAVSARAQRKFGAVRCPAGKSLGLVLRLSGASSHG